MALELFLDMCFIDMMKIKSHPSQIIKEMGMTDYSVALKNYFFSFWVVFVTASLFFLIENIIASKMRIA